MMIVLCPSRTSQRCHSTKGRFRRRICVFVKKKKNKRFRHDNRIKFHSNVSVCVIGADVSGEEYVFVKNFEQILVQILMSIPNVSVCSIGAIGLKDVSGEEYVFFYVKKRYIFKQILVQILMSIPNVSVCAIGDIGLKDVFGEECVFSYVKYTYF